VLPRDCVHAPLHHLPVLFVYARPQLTELPHEVLQLLLETCSSTAGSRGGSNECGLSSSSQYAVQAIAAYTRGSGLGLRRVVQELASRAALDQQGYKKATCALLRLPMGCAGMMCGFLVWLSQSSAQAVLLFLHSGSCTLDCGNTPTPKYPTCCYGCSCAL
jgi:hypothetical protein